MLSELAFSETTSGPVEQRRLKRWQLVNYLRVFDANSGDLLGHLVDLNQEGIMLLGTETLTPEKKFQLRMQLLQHGEVSEIELDAVSLWNTQDTDPCLYKTGFKLVDPSAELLNQLQSLIDDLGKPSQQQEKT
jgi:hypothetical protein